VVDQKEKQDKQDLMGWLSDLSEGAIQRISVAPGAGRAKQALKALGDRVDEMQRRTRGFEELEKRLTALEKRVDGMAKPKSSASRARTSKSGTTPKKS